MNNKLITALVLLGLVAVVLVMTRGRIEVNLLFTTVKGVASLVLLAFTAVGVVIGVLLK